MWPLKTFGSESSCRAGVSNTWPARCIFAVRERREHFEFWSNLVYFESFYCKLRLAKAFFSFKLRPAEHLFFGMWLSNRFEFEAPVVECWKIEVLCVPITFFYLTYFFHVQAENFSGFQMERLIKRRQMQKTLEDVGKELGQVRCEQKRRSEK